MAFLRAVEAQKPPAERICDDPYARAFIPDFAFTMSKLVIDSGLYERMAPGATTFVSLRERYIDDFLKAGLAEGLDQVVILGAGYDMRAHRIPGIEQTHVFEVDQPATQADKLKHLKKIVDPLPAYLSFVSVDFDTEPLGERLAGSGYREEGRTLFIWQGVTYFLTAAGVDQTLEFIAGHSGPGSSLIFDYFDNETLHDPGRSDVKALRRASRLSGEEYMFGVDKGQIEPFLTQRGFRDVRNVTLGELKERYFTGPNAGRTVPSGVAIASARVDRPVG